MPQHKQQVIINALSKFKQRIIWKFEESEEQGTLIGNILKVKWLPQYELLSKLYYNIYMFVGHVDIYF